MTKTQSKTEIRQENERLKELLGLATEFTLKERNMTNFDPEEIVVARIYGKGFPTCWTIRDNTGFVLGRKLTWESERAPSLKREKFIAEYRFKTRDAAIKIAKKYLKEVKEEEQIKRRLP